MANEQAISVLNQLLQAECQSLIPRLAECDPYVSLPAVEDRALVDRMIADASADQQELVSLIYKLRGAPIARTFRPDLSNIHYLDLNYLMPQIIAGVRELIRVYESVPPTGNRDADALIARILGRHRQRLAELQRIHANLAATPGGAHAVAAR